MPTNKSKKAPKLLDGRELASFIKEREAATVRTLRAEQKIPKLIIIRDSENPVITKYVELKKRYGADIGAVVEDVLISNPSQLESAITSANIDPSVSGIIIQLPLETVKNPEDINKILSKIAPEKDVDGLSGNGNFDSATATAIHWLLNGYDIDLMKQKIAVVGRGRLVGAPLIKMWRASGYDLTVFGHDSDLSVLKDFTLIVSATGVPALIKSEIVAPNTILVDAGTASENGHLVGDLDEALRARSDLAAITPKFGGVGPLTIATLFDHLLRATQKSSML